MGVPVADAGLPGHSGEAPVEGFRRVGSAVGVAEHEVVGLPGFAGFAAFTGLPGLMGHESGGRALWHDERTLRFRGLGVAGLAGRAPDVDHSPVEVYVVPSELAQFARAQAERDRQDEERF